VTLFRRENRNATVQQEVDWRGLGRNRLTTSGQLVNDEKALQLSAVWGCVDLLSTLVSTLPVDEFRKIVKEELGVTADEPWKYRDVHKRIPWGR
jgi:phage portal protein BeeE